MVVGTLPCSGSAAGKVFDTWNRYSHHDKPQWQKQKIGDLEDEKSRLQDSPDDSNAMATLKTRNLWIRTVNAFVAVADLADLAEDQDRLIFGPLRIANKAATKRARAGQAENEEQPGTTEGGEGAGTGVAPTTTTAAPETKDQ